MYKKAITFIILTLVFLIPVNSHAQRTYDELMQTFNYFGAPNQPDSQQMTGIRYNCGEYLLDQSALPPPVVGQSYKINAITMPGPVQNCTLSDPCPTGFIALDYEFYADLESYSYNSGGFPWPLTFNVNNRVFTAHKYPAPERWKITVPVCTPPHPCPVQDGWCRDISYPDPDDPTNTINGDVSSCYNILDDDFSQMEYDSTNHCFKPLCRKAPNFDLQAGITPDEEPDVDENCTNQQYLQDNPQYFEANCMGALSGLGAGGKCGCPRCYVVKMAPAYGPDQSNNPGLTFTCVKLSDEGYTCPDDLSQNGNPDNIADPLAPTNAQTDPRSLEEQYSDENRICTISDATPAPSNQGAPPPIHLRWTAEEPNILATLPIPFNSSGFGYKHHDLVFMSQVRDIGPPYMEPLVPLPDSLIKLNSSQIGAFAASDDITVIDGGATPDTLRMNFEESAAGSYIEIFAQEMSDRYNKWQSTLYNPFNNTSAGSGTIDSATPRGIKLSSLTEDQDIRNIQAKRFNLALKAASQAFAATRAATLSDKDSAEAFIHHPRAQDAIVGPRGCNIGGWYEMMLYQARCIRWFSLNCLCDYEKTFIDGSSEAWVLKESGMKFETVLPLAKDATAIQDFDKKRYLVDPDGPNFVTPNIAVQTLFPNLKIEVSQNNLTWPLMWRGSAGPAFGASRIDLPLDYSQEVIWHANPGLTPSNMGSGEYNKAYKRFVYDSVYKNCTGGSGTAPDCPGYISGMYPRNISFVGGNREGGPRLWDPYNCQLTGESSAGGNTCPFEAGTSFDLYDNRDKARYHYMHPEYKGLEHSTKGDIVVYDESLLSFVPSGVGLSVTTPDDNHPTCPNGNCLNSGDNLPSGFHDARYRRHVALVERVTRDNEGKPLSITVTEWNWGKNLDSCGNTDRWKILNQRTIFKDRKRYDTSGQEVPCSGSAENKLLCYYGPCDNPDNSECWEPNWHRIKLYRPSFDIAPTEDDGTPTPPVSGASPSPIIFPTCERYICYKDNTGNEAIKCPITVDADQTLFIKCNQDCTPTRESDLDTLISLDAGPTIPSPITMDMVKSQFVDRCEKLHSAGAVSDLNKCKIENWIPSKKEFKRTLREVYDLGEWRKSYVGLYDGNLVRHFLQKRAGSCEAPIDLRAGLPEKRPTGAPALQCVNKDLTLDCDKVNHLVQ